MERPYFVTGLTHDEKVDDMKEILQQLFEHRALTRAQAKEALTGIGKGAYNEHEVTAFMTVYLMRSVTIEELSGFRDALLELGDQLGLFLEQSDINHERL